MPALCGIFLVLGQTRFGQIYRDYSGFNDKVVIHLAEGNLTVSPLADKAIRIQFQDGNFDLRNISRKLIQVITQIALPFLYSSRNFGLLWHQYGLTCFNPADSIISLEKKDSAAKENEADL